MLQDCETDTSKLIALQRQYTDLEQNMGDIEAEIKRANQVIQNLREEIIGVKKSAHFTERASKALLGIIHEENYLGD